MRRLPRADRYQPRAELAWLTARGEVRTYVTEAMVHEAGAAIDEMTILLAGRMALSVAKGGAARRILRAGPGYVLGVIPYSRYQGAPGDVFVEEDATALVFHRRHFPDLVRECPELTAALVHQMLDRAREYRTAQLHDERMQSLGRLASGLAHEHAVDPGIAATLAASEVSRAALERLADAVPPEALGLAMLESKARAKSVAVRLETVVVRIVDDGRGISEEHRARTFDPFFTTKPVGQGTGLGLDLARRLVHLHAGDIDCTSQPGRTVFRVRRPVTGAKAGR